MESREKISRQIKLYLLRHNLSQTELAKKLGYKTHGSLNQVILCNIDCSRPMASALHKLDSKHFNEEFLIDVF